MIADVAHPAVLLSRHGAGELGRFVYRVLDGVSDKVIAAAGREGFRWVGGAVEHLGSSPFFVLEREAKVSEPLDLKVFAANDPQVARRDLGALLAQGFSIAGAFAMPQRPGGVVLLERRPGAVPRELEVLDDTDARQRGATSPPRRRRATAWTFWTQPVGAVRVRRPRDGPAVEEQEPAQRQGP